MKLIDNECIIFGFKNILKKNFKEGEELHGLCLPHIVTFYIIYWIEEGKKKEN